jgi:hypothetical protein
VCNADREASSVDGSTRVDSYSTRVGALLDRLEGVIPAGDGRWYARCPAHEDRSPSLAIRNTSEKILLFCHAHCATEDVLTALGLTFRDLYRDPWRASHAAATAYQGRDVVGRMLRDVDSLDVERMVLRIAADDLRAGKTLSTEDRARVKIARLRLQAAERKAA